MTTEPLEIHTSQLEPVCTKEEFTLEEVKRLRAEKEELLKEVIRLAQESVKREQKLAKLEAEAEIWAEAGQERRLVILPCKIGDVVYATAVHVKCVGCPDNQIHKCKLYDGKCDRKNRAEVREIEFNTNCFSLHTRKLVHGIFLTREEAEAALAEMRGGKRHV